jgi:hypothetical protein
MSRKAPHEICDGVTRLDASEFARAASADSAVLSDEAPGKRPPFVIAAADRC